VKREGEGGRELGARGGRGEEGEQGSCGAGGDEEDEQGSCGACRCGARWPPLAVPCAMASALLLRGMACSYDLS